MSDGTDREIHLKTGEWVEIRPFDEIRATLDAQGEHEHMPFMPEMLALCGRRARITAVMSKICGGGRGMKAVAGAPLILLDDLRCEGSAHGQCSRACTLLWKPAWLRRVDGPRSGQAEESDAQVGRRSAISWAFPTRTETGAYSCQATALPRATLPVSKVGKALSAARDVQRGEWTIAMLVKVYWETVTHRVNSWIRRRFGKKAPTPVERLGLQAGDWVQVKSFEEISATLDRNNKNRGLEFSRYMLPFCGRTYQVLGRMENFINEWTGEIRKLENTVLLTGVACGGETTSGPCRRAEYLYWREVWLRKVEAPATKRHGNEASHHDAGSRRAADLIHARAVPCGRPCLATVQAAGKPLGLATRQPGASQDRAID